MSDFVQNLFYAKESPFTFIGFGKGLVLGFLFCRVAWSFQDFDARCLTIIIEIPLLGGFFTYLIKNDNSAKVWGLLFSLVVFLYSLVLWFHFDLSQTGFQFVSGLEENQALAQLPALWNLQWGVDGVALVFVLLTTLLTPLCLVASWKVIAEEKANAFGAYFLILEAVVLGVFLTTNLLWFYIIFEIVLVPMFLLIGVFGSRERKVRAGYIFFIYTFAGSVLILLAILFLAGEVNDLSFSSLQLVMGSVDPTIQKLLWLAFFASFAVKVPMIPFHVWLPEAHVEAPTAGSVILAGILLKLGTFGFIRYSIGLMPEASLYFAPLIYVMGILGIIYTSLTAVRQSDIKRVIAYASVAHINITLVGLFSFAAEAIEGAVFQMVAHGLVSGGLFLCVGVLYDRHHTRLIPYYSGITHQMPLFVTAFLILTIANIGFPGTISFPGEFIILTGVWTVNSWACFLSGTSLVLGGGYSLWLFNRIAYGNLRSSFWTRDSDITFREVIVFVPLVVGVLVFGIWTGPVMDLIHIVTVELLQAPTLII
jgi:NADH-quinone oxidoreductase subunit M